MRHRRFARDVPPGFANHQRDLAFVIKCLGRIALWQLQCLALADDGIVVFGEKNDVIRIRRRHAFDRVFLAVVNAHANDFVVRGQGR